MCFCDVYEKNITLLHLYSTPWIPCHMVFSDASTVILKIFTPFYLYDDFFLPLGACLESKDAFFGGFFSFCV